MQHRTPASLAIVVLLAAALLMSACGSPSTTPTAQPPAPTAPGPTGPQPGADASWDTVKAAGKLIVGTSADYPPYSFYTADFKLDGYDIALMKAVGVQLGVTIEFNDFAFEGLPGAIQLGQVNAGIAALSVTPDRQGLVDFTNVYYVGKDGILAAANSNITSVTSLADFAGRTVAVQRGSVYEAWAVANLVADAQGGALYTSYTNADEVIKAVAGGQAQLGMLDYAPSQAAAAGGTVKQVGQGLNQQLFAIAVPKGANALRDQINQALTRLQNDGTLSKLAEQYLKIKATDLPPMPTPVPTPAAPVPTAVPPACVDGMKWVADLTLDDKGMTSPPVIQPGQAFQKGWRIQNNGTCDWQANYALVFSYGNAPEAGMGAAPLWMNKVVKPGETIDVTANLVAPANQGVYQGFWAMRNNKNVPFGETVWVGITVPGTPGTKPIARPTPLPATSLDFNAKVVTCKLNPTPQKPGGVLLTLTFEAGGGPEPLRYFDIDAGAEVPKTYDRAAEKGSGTIVALAVQAADGQYKEKKFKFNPGDYCP